MEKSQMIVFHVESVLKYVKNKLLHLTEEAFPLIWINVYYVKTVQYIVRLMQFLNLQCIKMKSKMDSISLNRNYVCTVDYVIKLVHMMQLIKLTVILLLMKKIVFIVEHVRMHVQQEHFYSKEILKIQ